MKNDILDPILNKMLRMRDIRYANNPSDPANDGTKNNKVSKKILRTFFRLRTVDKKIHLLFSAENLNPTVACNKINLLIDKMSIPINDTFYQFLLVKKAGILIIAVKICFEMLDSLNSTLRTRKFFQLYKKLLSQSDNLSSVIENNRANSTAEEMNRMHHYLYLIAENLLSLAIKIKVSKHELLTVDENYNIHFDNDYYEKQDLIMKVLTISLVPDELRNSQEFLQSPEKTEAYQLAHQQLLEMLNSL